MRALHGDLKLRAFSLVEVVVASAVFAVMVTLLLTVVSHVNGIWQQADAQKLRRQAGRMLLETISRDLASALVPVPGRGNAANIFFLLNPPALGSGSRDAIFWQTRVQRDGLGSDIAQVGYFVRWTGARGALCRVFLFSDDPDYRVYENPDTWLTDTYLSQVAPADESGDFRGLVSEHVLALWVTLFDAAGNQIVGAYDSRVAGGLPVAAEIAIAIADPSAMQRITSSTEITGHYSASTIDEFVEQLPESIRSNTQIFRTRVPLEAAR